MRELNWIPHSSSYVSGEDFAYIRDLADRNFVGQGPLSQRLVHRLSGLSGSPHVTLASSGTAALTLALAALRGLQAGGREVVVSTYVCPSVINAILSAGLTPRFADVCEDSLNVNWQSVRDALCERSVAVICTNIGGIPDDLPDGGLGRVPVISDCAQAIGSQLRGRSLLGLGDVGIVSFGPTKMVTAGVGGAVMCRDPALATAINQLVPTELAVQTYSERGFVPTFGERFSDVNAGLALAQLDRLDAFIARRRSIALRFDEVLRNTDVRTAMAPAGAVVNHYRYYFFSEYAPNCLNFLRSFGIDARSSISHNMADYYDDVSVPKSARSLAKQLVSLPIHCAMTDVQVDQVVDALMAWMSGRGVSA